MVSCNNDTTDRSDPDDEKDLARPTLYILTNASQVSKHGRQALESTLVSNPGASRLLPPMPYNAASDAYRELN